MNPSFEVLMKDSYIKQDYMHIPKYFYEHLPESHSTTVLHYDGEPWFMEINMGKRGWFKDGWKYFVMNNNIKRGWLINFDLVEITEFCVIFQLHVTGRGTLQDPVEIN
ncbi:hypothetical protein A4A49_57355 [Nicotiana attenuata]|uniref:TF-B3 domain-containing protein n=1 Tax=Nicotiana attenuata TaxID=49451 RepID=A0A314L526_NICAT|nr:hypothetical protein A4A49_57355 [Nicotiana attenuata]